jgi:hypothetical protein
MKIWHEQTSPMSIGIERHPAFMEILNLNMKVDLIQLAISDLEEYSRQCFPILRTIVKNPPDVPDEMRGRIKQLIKLWQDWGEKNGYHLY